MIRKAREAAFLITFAGGMTLFFALAIASVVAFYLRAFGWQIVI